MEGRVEFGAAVLRALGRQALHLFVACAIAAAIYMLWA